MQLKKKAVYSTKYEGQDKMKTLLLVENSIPDQNSKSY